MKIDMENLDSVDVVFLTELDSLTNPPVWLRDDYLSMRGMAFCGDRKLYDYLERVAWVKECMYESGYEFNCDKI